MVDVIEKRICIKFCFHNKISVAKAFEIFQRAFKGGCLSKRTVFDLYKKFNDDGKFIIDYPLSSKLSALIIRAINKVRELVLGDRCLTIRDVEQVLASLDSCQPILEDYLEL